MKWIRVWFILWNVMFEVKNNWLLTAYSGIFDVSKTSRTLSELWKCDSECLSFFTSFSACRLLFISTLPDLWATFCAHLWTFHLNSTIFQSLTTFWTFIPLNFAFGHQLCIFFLLIYSFLLCFLVFCEDTAEPVDRRTAGVASYCSLTIYNLLWSKDFIAQEQETQQSSLMASLFTSLNNTFWILQRQNSFIMNAAKLSSEL